jgi:hypothetical protein
MANPKKKAKSQPIIPGKWAFWEEDGIDGFTVGSDPIRQGGVPRAWKNVCEHVSHKGTAKAIAAVPAMIEALQTIAASGHADKCDQPIGFDCECSCGLATNALRKAGVKVHAAPADLDTATDAELKARVP